eukprot:2921393-Pyramimonas_sp.AAC.1
MTCDLSVSFVMVTMCVPIKNVPPGGGTWALTVTRRYFPLRCAEGYCTTQARVSRRNFGIASVGVPA